MAGAYLGWPNFELALSPGHSQFFSREWPSLVLRSRPAFRHFQYGLAGRGPGIFSHVSDVRIERVVERV